MNIPYGNNLKLTVEGGSHDEFIALELKNFPAGFRPDYEELLSFMQRRAPGRSAYSTARLEPDRPEFVSGLTDGLTDGSTIRIIIRSLDAHSSDYHFNDTPRPSHADFAAVMKYGPQTDLRGGGKFSGRLTALTCAAGGLCLQYLRSHGVTVLAHIAAVGDVKDDPFDPVKVGAEEKKLLDSREFRVLNEKAGEEMQALIARARAGGDSVGGIVECAVCGLAPGLGEHMFAGVEARIASAVFSIPAVKGIEFGSGFAGALLRGSQNNDPFVTDGKTVTTRTNNCGGILGGMTDGMPVVFRAAVKPTPSIAAEQDTVSLSRMENVRIRIGGRHDPCIVPRAVPVFEAAAALAVLDMLLDKD